MAKLSNDWEDNSTKKQQHTTWSLFFNHFSINHIYVTFSITMMA
tara:strand:+ start:576 stop:707 length:132 start_codon:yes stop_codon:yes gene_type:complete